VEDRDLSYRRSVTESSLPIYRWDGEVTRAESSERAKSMEQTQTLAHTTVFRWITTLANMAPPTALKPDLGVPERKSKTHSRKRKLLACRHFCRVKRGCP
jgi:hypothetical protein